MSAGAGADVSKKTRPEVTDGGGLYVLFSQLYLISIYMTCAYAGEGVRFPNG